MKNRDRILLLSFMFLLDCYNLGLFVLFPIMHPDLTSKDLLFQYVTDSVLLPNLMIASILIGIDRSQLPKIYNWLFYLSLSSIGIWFMSVLYRIIRGIFG